MICAPAPRLSLPDVAGWALPQLGLDNRVNAWREENRTNFLRRYEPLLEAWNRRIPTLYGQLYLRVVRASGRVEDLGVASTAVVTNTGVNFIVDAFQNLVELEIMKFHGLGTGVTAEAVADTGLVTELTTQYNPDNTRATGTLTENGANVYRTVATNTVDAVAAVTEHGIFSQAATGGGVLLDRSVFSVVNLSAGDGLQSSYDFTISSGG